IGPPRRREQGSRSLARGAGSATDGGVLRTVEHARRHFGAAKTPQDARTMATSRIVASRLGSPRRWSLRGSNEGKLNAAAMACRPANAKARLAAVALQSCEPPF